EEMLAFQYGFVNDHFHPFGLDALHHTLDGALAEIIRAGLHNQAVDADGFWVAFEDGVGNEVLAGGVGVYDGADQVAGHVGVVGQQLFGVLGQAVAAVAEAGVVVVVANTRIQANAFDDLAGVQAMGFGIGVQLVEVGHAHGEIG